MTDQLHQKNRIIGLAVLAVVIFMIGLAFAAVPLYNLFCRVTGYGGTTQVAGEVLPDKVLDRTVTVNFDATTAPGMPWYFAPQERRIQVKLGQQAFTAFIAKSEAGTPTAGTALYNVVPNKAGKYFHKIECFCFGEQILNPHEKVNMPVLFYIDPAMNDDPNMEEVKTITLSYTFYEADSKVLDQALEAFYNQEEIDPRPLPSGTANSPEQTDKTE